MLYSNDQLSKGWVIRGTGITLTYMRISDRLSSKFMGLILRCGSNFKAT